MADLNAVETPPGDNPLLKALHQYKHGTTPAPVQDKTGGLNPFGDLAVKKKVSTPAASTTSNGSQSGGTNGQDFNPFPLNGQAQLAHDQQVANTPNPQFQGMPQDAPIFNQNNPDDKAAVQQFIANQNTPEAQLNNPGSQYYQDLEKQRKDFEKAHPGNWGNTLPIFEHALVGAVTKPLAGLAHVSVDLANKLGDDHTAGSFTNKLALGLDSYNNATTEQDQKNPLPNTFFGNVTSGLINIAPIAGAAALAPEAELGTTADMGVNAASLAKLKSVVINPFTKISAIKGGLESYDLARQQGRAPAEAAKEGLKGAVHEGISAATMNVLGSIGGEFISPKIANGLTSTGILTDGKLTKMGVDAVTDAAIFGAYPIASNLLQGKPFDLKEAETNAGIGGFFGLLKAAHTAGEFEKADAPLQEFKQNRQAVAMNNFLDASPDAIKEAYELPDNAADLNAKAVDYAAQAKKETDPEKRAQLAAASSTYSKLSNVKTIAQSLLADKASFVEGINNSELSAPEKQAVLDKVNAVHTDLTENLKQKIGKKISAIDEDLKNLQPIADGLQDPVEKTEAEVGIENLTKLKNEAYKALKGVIKEQHEDIQNQVNTPPIEPTVENGVPQAPQEAPAEKVNETPETNIGEQENGTLSQQETAKMGIRDTPEMGEKMGGSDRPKEPTTTSEQASGRTEVKADDVKEEQLIKAIDSKAKELKDKDNATTAKLKAQKADIIDQMQEVHAALDGDGENVDAVKKAGYEVDKDGKVIFNVKDDGVFKVHKDWFIGTDGLDQIKKEFPERIDKAPQGKPNLTPKRSTERQLAENRPNLEATERRLQNAKDNLVEANRLKDEKMAKVWQAEVDREQKVYDIAKYIKYSPIKTTENGNNEEGLRAENGQESGQNGQQEKTSKEEKPIPTKEEVTQGKAGKIKIKDNNLLQPYKLKGSEYHLALGELPDGKFGIVDTNSGLTISKPYDSDFEARLAYSQNREKLTPELIKKAKEALDIQDESKAKLVNLNDKAKAGVTKDLKPNGITADQIRDYEQSRTNTGLPANNAEDTGRIPEDVRQANDESRSADENIKGETVREQPEKSAGAVKRGQYLEQSKKELSQALKKARSETNIGVNPELLKSMAKVIKAYADIGIHKFADIVNDWLKTYHDTTDEDVDALKSAYAAHLANLDPKERKPYNTPKELDQFMAERKKPVATLPKRQIPAQAKLPVPVDELPEKQKDETKRVYTRTAALKSYTIRNLEQLRAFTHDIKNFDAYDAVRKYATSRSQASVILKTATKAIKNLVGSDGWTNLREALVESRLRGAKERWNGYADQIEKQSDSDLHDLFKDGKDGNMYSMIKTLQPLEGEGNPADFAASLIGAARYDEARQYISDVFKHAADNVITLGTLSNGKTFDDQVKDGKFTDHKMQQALEAYKEFIEKPIADSHASNEGIFSDALGPLDTYFPMTRLGGNEKARIPSKGNTFNAPQNINNKMFTGQGDNYSTAIADFSNKLVSSIKTNNKSNAIDALKEAGLVVDIPHNHPDDGNKIQIGDEVFDAVKEKVKDSRMIINDGKITHTPSKYVLMPKWLHDEMKPIFNSTDEFDKYSLFGKVANTLIKFQLGGPLEATAHAYRLTGVITGSNPYVTEWAYKNGLIGKAGGLIANNPVTKSFLTIGKILATDISSDDALRTIQKMANEGFIPEKTWQKTWNREFAEDMGAKALRLKVGKIDIPAFWDFSPLLYGNHSFDLKARVLMYRLTDAMNPQATPELHQKMQEELGVYTKALQSTLGRNLKESGMAPYYTFGSAIYKAGLQAVTGTSPLALERPTIKQAFTTKMGAKQTAKLIGYKAAQLVTGGVVGAVAYWMTAYHAITGKWPWEDETSKLGRVPMPESLKNDFTKKFAYNEKTGEWDDIDIFGSQFPVLGRGLRAIGAPKAWETNQLGGTAGQSVEAASNQALNTFVSPLTSAPGTQFVTTAVTGRAPYITNNRNDKGQPDIGLFRKVNAVGFGEQYLANAMVATESLNPALEKGINYLNQKTGFEKSLFGINSIDNNVNADQAGVLSLFGYIRDIALPRLFTPHGNDAAKAHFIQKGQQDLQKTMAKEAE